MAGITSISSVDRMITMKPALPVIDWNNSITRKLVFDMPMVERGSTTFRDLVKRNNGTSTGSPGFVMTQNGIALSFDGATQYIRTTTTPSTFTDNFSIETLCSFTSIPTEGMVFYNGNDNAGYGVEVNGGTFRILFGGVIRFDTTKNVGTNLLYHLVLRRQSGNTTLFVNGVDLNLSFTNTPGTPTFGMSVGIENGGLNDAIRFFPGIINYIRMWERPLSYPEVKQLYSNPWQIYKQPNFYQSLNLIATAVANWPILTGKKFWGPSFS